MSTPRASEAGTSIGRYLEFYNSCGHNCRLKRKRPMR